MLEIVGLLFIGINTVSATSLTPPGMGPYPVASEFVGLSSDEIEHYLVGRPSSELSQHRT
ncbi:hypothetical protein [Aestuariibacter salexigens]|uniref:hypothetical protein n=1 Tax=Aestuariibacter salexigens TaxID=226010 RepID=UPI000401FA1F|nr:hypothetical protein [Aestuariibacter salexigens]